MFVIENEKFNRYSRKSIFTRIIINIDRIGRIKLFRELKCELISWTRELLEFSLIRENRKELKR